MQYGPRTAMPYIRPMAIIKSGSELSPGEYVCISVHDEGSDMDAETLHKVTTPFFYDQGRRQGYKGTGLCLPMVQGFMAQSVGTLTVKSKPGEGMAADL